MEATTRKRQRGNDTFGLPYISVFGNTENNLFYDLKRCCWTYLLPDQKPVTHPSGKDLHQPNEFWSKESCDLYYKLQGEFQDGDWKKFRRDFSGIPPGHKPFPYAFLGQGTFFEFALFTSEREKKLKGVVQFGRLTAGFMHG